MIGVRLNGMIQDIQSQIESEEREKFLDKKLSEHKVCSNFYTGTRCLADHLRGRMIGEDGPVDRDYY
jgi:hypothetical protein